MRIQGILIATIFAAFTLPAFGEETPVRRWGQRELQPSVLARVYQWLPQEERERLRSMPLEDVLEFLEKQRKDSPYRYPWKRKELNDEPNADALLQIFDDKKQEDRNQLMAEVPYIDAVQQLKRAASEGSGAAAPLMSIQLEEPDARNPGSNNGRISLRGTTTGVDDKLRVRIEAELRYPERDSQPVLATGRVMVKNNKFKLDIQLPRKEFLLGKYWVRVQLDFGKVRDKSALMSDGELPTITATRACFVGIDEKYRQSPVPAPDVIRQDIRIKTWYLALIEYQPIEIGSASYPADSPDAPYWDQVERDLQTQRDTNRAGGVIPALELRDMITARALEMKEYFDPTIWRELLDSQVYPAIEAGEKLVRDRQEAVLQERFPEYSKYFLDRAGIYRMLSEYAALKSQELYEAAALELPGADASQIRTRGRKPQDCLNLIQHNLNYIYERRHGISVLAIADLFRQLDEQGGSR